jgi:hypothetical protein
MLAASTVPSDISQSSSAVVTPNPVVQKKVMVVCLVLILA